MMNRYILDTSFLSSYFNKNDSNYSKAVDMWSNVDSESLILVPVTVLIEFIHVFRKLDLLKDISIFDFINDLSDEVLYFDELTMRNYEVFIQNNNINLKPNDSTILYFADLKDAEILSFDKKLVEAQEALF